MAKKLSSIREMFFTLILNGKVEVISGTDEFKSESGPWSFLGVRALSQAEFIPDFSARVLTTTRILRIFRNDFVYALDDTIDGGKIPLNFSWVEPIIAERRARKILKTKQSSSPGSPSSPSVAKPTSSSSSSGGGDGDDKQNDGVREIEMKEVHTQIEEPVAQPDPDPIPEHQEIQIEEEGCDPLQSAQNDNSVSLVHSYQESSSHLILQIADGSGYDDDPNAYIPTNTAIRERPDDIC